MKTYHLVAREFVSRVFDRKFVIATICTPLLLGLMMVLPTYLARRDTGKQLRIAVIDASGMNLRAGLEEELLWDRLTERKDQAAAGDEAGDGAPRDGVGEPASPPLDAAPRGLPRFVFEEFAPSPDVAPPPPLSQQLGFSDQVLLQMLTGRRDATALRIRDEFVWNPASEELRRRVEAREFDALLVVPPHFATDNYVHFFAKSTGDLDLIGRLRAAVSRVQQKARIEAAGVDAETLQRLTARTIIDPRNIKEEERAKGRTNPLQSFMTLMLLYFTIILYGTAIMNSVLEDKQSRIAEVMLATVNARQFLLGKVVGVGVAGMLQYGIWIAMYLGAAAVWPNLVDSQWSIPLRSLPIIGASFLVGYAIYATLYAVVGAVAENTQDAQQLQWPVLMFLIMPLVAVWAVLREPEAPFSQFLTWFPMTLPLILPARMVIAPVPTWQILAGYAAAAVFALVLVWLAGRIFQAVILMYGKKPSLREFFRMMLAAEREPVGTARQ